MVFRAWYPGLLSGGTPGETDKLQTVKLKNGAAVCEIKLVDHIIVAGNEYFSFADEGLL